MSCSGLTGDGLSEIWERVEDHRFSLTASGAWDEQRRAQQLSWMWSTVEDRLMAAMRADPAVHEVLAEAERSVLDGETTPAAAAEYLIQIHLDQNA